MQTTLTIECDIRDAQEILYEASKIIDKRNEYPPAKFKVKCPKCSCISIRSCNTRCPNCRAMIKASDVIPEQGIKYDDRKEWSEARSRPDLKEVYFPANAQKMEDLKWKPAPGAVEDFTVAGQSSMEPAEVMCPHCDWTGYIIELKIDIEKNRRCPKCHGHIIGEDVDVTKKGVV